ncbi:MAG: acyltransferase [Chitinophagales bacterium]|nr:acyltransferase [Chitinophagales bacterium]
MSLIKDHNKPKLGYIPAFDGIRGVFSFTILIIHLHFSYVTVPSTLGYFTMHCFFIMSAYLLSRSLLKDKTNATSFGSYFKNFYTKRILRIFPVYYGYIFLAVIIGLITLKTKANPILGVVYEIKHFWWMLLTFTYNFKDLLCLYTGLDYAKSPIFPHLWSLSLEEQFYFVIPFVIYFVSIKRLKTISIIIICIFPIFRILGYYYLINHPNIHQQIEPNMFVSFILYRCTFFQFDAFFYGILVAIVDFKNKKLIKFLFYTMVFLLIASIVFNGIIVSKEEGISFTRAVADYDFMIKNGQIFYIDIIVNSLCVFMFYLSFKFNDALSIFENKFFIHVGKISFGVYVYQYLFIIPTVVLLFPYLKMYMTVWLAEIICATICFGALLIFSDISFNKYEMYFINLKKNITK